MVPGIAFGRMAKSIGLNFGGAVAPIVAAAEVLTVGAAAGALVRAARANDKKAKGPGM